MSDSTGHDEHLAAETIAAYLDGRVNRGAARQIREHMVECDECRADVLDASRALEHIGGRRRRWIVPTVAAAAAAGLLLIGGPSVRDGGESPALRGPDSVPIAADAARIGVVSPRGEERVPPMGFRLTWRSVGDEATYAVTVTDLGGDPVWRADTRDTSLVVTATAGLESGAEYRWYVDALRSDGSTSTSGMQRIRVGSGPPDP